MYGATMAVAQHPFGRVFKHAIGETEAPVPESWSVGDDKRLYFTGQPRQIASGDHVFVLGVGWDRAVLGLFETTDGPERHPHPDQPRRWPWSIAAVPLAAVIPSEAHAVPDVSTPRGGTPVRIKDPVQRAGLYAAISDGELTKSASGVSQAAGSIPERKSRPFDRSRRVNPPKATSSRLESDEQQAMQEKAVLGHAEVLARLSVMLESSGWRKIEEIPAAIDLWAIEPAGERRVIFEAKTISDKNELSQCRSALAQLLEYRVAYGSKSDGICVVTDSDISHRRGRLLDQLDVALVVVTEGGCQANNELGALIADAMR